MLALSVEGTVHLPKAVILSIAVVLITSAVQAYLLLTLKKKGLRKSFPFFYMYIAAYAAITLVLTLADLALGPATTTYFFLYWILNTVLMLLGFAIMYEVLVHAMKPYSGLIDLAKMLFGWAALFLLLASGLTAFSTAGSHIDRCIAATSYLERGLLLMQCGLLVLFLVFERRLGLSWRNHSISIALGLGAIATSSLISTFFITHYPSLSIACDLGDNLIYLGVVVAWVACFRLPQPQRRNVLDSPSRLIFQRWNEALLTYSARGEFALASGAVDSFLPGVEQTVDRVLARKITQ